MANAICLLPAPVQLVHDLPSRGVSDAKLSFSGGGVSSSEVAITSETKLTASQHSCHGTDGEEPIAPPFIACTEM